jgi:hypothetical protein
MPDQKHISPIMSMSSFTAAAAPSAAAADTASTLPVSSPQIRLSAKNPTHTLESNVYPPSHQNPILPKAWADNYQSKYMQYAQKGKELL